MSLVQVKDVTYRRAGRDILNAINWDTQPGEHWVILGPNGAGKTTLAAIVAGRAHPTSGQVQVLERRLGYMPVEELHQMVGLCSSAILKSVPAGQNVENLILSASYGTLVKGRDHQFESEDYMRRTSLMRLFGLSGLGARDIRTLSDGERGRALIARSLMADPELLILDEPVAGVDLTARELLLGALTELASHPDSPQLLLVTHHLEEIPPGFTHALLLKQGQVVQAGPIESTLTSQNLSEVFGLKLQVGRNDNGRWWAQA